MIQAPSSCKHRPTQTPPAAAASTPTGLSSLLQTATAMLPPGVALNVVPSSSMPMMIPQPKAPAAAAPHQQPKKPEHHHHHHRHNHHHNHPMAGPKSRALRFHRKYAELCRRRNVPPLQDLRERSKSVLDFYCDRVRLDDWTLVLQALMGDTQLVGLGVRARKPCAHVLETIDNEKKCRGLRNQSAFCSKFIFHPLVEVIANCVANSSVLNALILEGLPLNGRYVQQIARALLLNSSVRYVSFARSNVGDEGCEQLCTTLKHLPNVDRLNFSGCYLSTRGAESLAALLKYQKIIRFTEGWRQSLRYRDVEADQIPGLKYVALNQNADVGDAGLQALLGVLVEDEWIRGMEMQQCGVTDAGARSIVRCLNVNKALLVFDVRNNAGISVQTMNEMREQLGIEVEPTTTTTTATTDATMVIGGGGGGDGMPLNGSGRVSLKARIAQSKERICSLEQRLAVDVEQRKQAEALNEKLHGEMVQAQREIAAKTAEAAVQSADHAAQVAAAAAELPPDFTLVSKEQLHSLLMEVNEHHQAVVRNAAVVGQQQQPPKPSEPKRQQLLSSSSVASSSGARSVRKAKSEHLEAKKINGQQAGSKISKSECKIRHKEQQRPKSPHEFVERGIGDFMASQHDEYHINSPPNNRFSTSENILKKPSAFFNERSEEESDADDADADAVERSSQHVDFYAHGDC